MSYNKSGNYDKPVTEEELQERAEARGDGAERVTLDQLEQTIVFEHYLNPEEVHPLTICVLELQNGFMLVGHSAPADPDNFNEAIGRRLARQKAVDQIWPLLGFALREKIWLEQTQADMEKDAGEE